MCSHPETMSNCEARIGNRNTDGMEQRRNPTIGPQVHRTYLRAKTLPSHGSS